MKKLYLLSCILMTITSFSQINSPSGNNLFYYNGNADLTFRYQPRGNGGRALVHADGNILGLNFESDFTGGTRIGNQVFFKDGGNSYINSGNLGVGTGNPLAKLHINNGDNSYGAILANATESSFSLYTKTLTTNPFSESFRLGLKYLDNENNSFISFYRGGSVAGGFLGFSTNGQERIRISDAGNVGIGTSSPLTKLDVRGHISVWGTGNAEEHGEINFENSNHGIRRLGNIVDVFTAGGIESGITFTNRVYNASTNSYSNMLVALKIASDGNVGIGTINPTSKLTVAGNIHSREVKVTVDAGADFVFENDYNLPSLESVDKFIKENNHLPEIASADEMKKDGINLSEMNIKLLQKIEELTLYSIDQNKKIEAQDKEIEALKDLVLRVSKLESELARK